MSKRVSEYHRVHMTFFYSNPLKSVNISSEGVGDKNRIFLAWWKIMFYICISSWSKIRMSRSDKTMI